MITCTFEDGGTGLLRHVVVDCIVVKNGKILLGKRSAKLLEGGKWALLGGYVNRDESLIQAASREVMEESGWQIQDLRLLRIKDNPNRKNEDRQNVSFVYVADAVAQTGEPDWENDKIEWFGLDNLPARDTIAFDHYDDIAAYISSLQA